MILHNLAVLNFIEISDHNDRIINGDDNLDEASALEQIEKVENEKAE